MTPRVHLHNLRLGFANNSSSTHSIILLDPGAVAKDDQVEDRTFGWAWWTAASKSAKLDYLTITIEAALRSLAAPEPLKKCADLLGVNSADLCLNARRGDEYSAPYIDHQSIIALPRTWDGTDLDSKFIDEFRNFLLRDDVMIFGGNDNDEAPSPGPNGKVVLSNLPVDRCREEQIVARKDKAGFWTLFNRANGTKIRMSWNDQLRIDKSEFPELVDLKITDFCPVGCAFCYQGSTVKGKHASLEQITKTAHALREMRVFEVALGGGEPTLHPDFEQILHLFRELNIVPNYTTKLMPQKKHIELCGSLAFSVSSPEEVNAIAKVAKTLDEALVEKITFQCVLGAMPLGTLPKIIRTAHQNHFYNFTLLGFKSQHRGKTFKPFSYEAKECLDALKKEGLHHIGIDTALATEFAAELQDRCIPSWMYSTQEGKFSMYIDLVEKKMGPSSYCDESQYVPLELTQIASAFSQW